MARIYKVIMGNLFNDKEKITLSIETTKDNAEQKRKAWRKVLGNKNWTVDRRPGMDTLDNLTISIVEVIR